MDDLADAMRRFQECIENRDREVADALLEDDYALVLVQPGHAVMPRARWLEVLGDYIVHSNSTDESVIDVDGDLAVVLHRDRMAATVMGQDRSGAFVITDVWRRREGQWRLWRRHSTPLHAGVLPGA